MLPLIIQPLSGISEFIASRAYSNVFVLTDENTVKYCYPVVEPLLRNHVLLKIPAGEPHKTLNTCTSVWQQLTIHEADRNSLLINLGGGMVGDLGGFAAGCYKRGIDFVNIPTSLLAMVDASVGAKTGIDFLGYKNLLGLFYEPQKIFLHTDFLKTLPHREFRSGMAEVMKHALIADKTLWGKLPLKFLLQNMENVSDLVLQNIAIKSKFVIADPTEKGVRQALNFGHTIGHALESLLLTTPQPLLHGEAVAAGIVMESFLSMKVGLLTNDELEAIVKAVSLNFDLPVLTEEQHATIIHYLKNDKKNRDKHITCCFLDGIGNYSLPHYVTEKDIFNALDFYNDVAT